MFYKKYIKRILDVVLSFMALLILSPVLLITAILLSIFNQGAGIIFSQPRIGFNNHEFKIYKFKTMNQKRDADGNLLPDIQRITPIGRFIRRTSLDELPQLWNVIRGEMSLIGPRPLLIEYLPLYSEQQLRRHNVMPGITGWAQCHGRNALKWSDKFNLDLWYVDNCSFKVDANILLITIKNVLKRENIENSQSAKFTMEPFDGTN